jgi:hypothetical protein
MKTNKTDQRTFDLPSASRLLNAYHLIWKEKNPNLFQKNASFQRLNEIIKNIHSLDFLSAPGLAQTIYHQIKSAMPTGIPPMPMTQVDMHINEFWSLLDIHDLRLIAIDPNIELKLGLPASDYNLKTLAGHDPIVQLYHPSDVHHVIRWVMLVFLLLMLPILRWKFKEDIFRIHFRSSTADSNSKELRDIKYVCLEKKTSFWPTHLDGIETEQPQYLLTKVAILPVACFHHVNVQFVSTPIRETAVNGLLFLFNLMLIDMPIKHLLFLHERMIHRQISAATLSINRQIQKHHHIENFYTEKQICDCIQKTIRKRISHICHDWSRSELKIHEFCNSDSEAIEHAKKLGLLPIPESILHLIYKNSSIIQ